MRKVIQEGQKVHIRLPGKSEDYEYDGVVTGFTQLKSIQTGELTDRWLISVKCGCCGVVEAIPEQYLASLPLAEQRDQDEHTAEQLV